MNALRSRFKTKMVLKQESLSCQDSYHYGIKFFFKQMICILQNFKMT